MIESHCDPDQAWSDAAQQLTPTQLKQIFEEIIWRKVDSPSSQYHTALDALRREINQYDEEVLQILSRRMQVAEKIGQYKQEHQITILQTGAGATTVNVTAGVTLNATPQGTANQAKLRAQWSSVTLIKRATDTWVALGDLQA